MCIVGRKGRGAVPPGNYGKNTGEGALGTLGSGKWKTVVERING